MTQAPAYAEAPLQRLASGLGTHIKRAVRVQWDTGPRGEPRAWLEVHCDALQDYRRVASLTIRERGSTVTYAVGRPDRPGAEDRFAALATAVRALQKAAMQTLKDRAVSDAPAPQIAPPAPRPPKAPTYTAAEAIAHPAIRVAILAGREIAEATGYRPEAATLIALVNAALPLVALVEDVCRPSRENGDPAGAAWTERVLVATLSEALRAAAYSGPSQPGPFGNSEPPR